VSRLAIDGGRPIRTRAFPVCNTIGAEEKRAVMEVLECGVLSRFIGADGADFNGGPRVRALEDAWAEYFGTRHAVALNSATSGLYAAVGAARVGPGDEVIVSPYTMSASAAAAVIYGARPVFADIEPDTFCLDPASVRERVTSRTRAIIGVDLFGHPAAWGELRAIGEEHGLVLIEDAAQAPGARLDGRYAGTCGDLGVFSLNYHKTIHCGEGGVLVTDDADLAERVRLIRNHGEAVVKARGTRDIVNLVGFNYRMTEIEAAIAREQLRKLDGLVRPRIEAAFYLTERLRALPGVTPPVIRPEARHGFYVYAIRFDARGVGMDRARLAAALAAEGIPVHQGYVEPLYRQPMYQRGIGFGADGYPFRRGDRAPDGYVPGLCPVAERMYDRELLYLTVCHAAIERADLDDVAAAFEKVLEQAAAGVPA
jgi:dTDP-4-amino-4,6-dideoxygalactose transaminase